MLSSAASGSSWGNMQAESLPGGNMVSSESKTAVSSDPKLTVPSLSPTGSAESVKTEVLEVEDAPESDSKRARVEGLSLGDLGLAIGATVEVAWVIERENMPSERVWWTARIETDDNASDTEAGSARLVYAAQHGFEEESRRVTFLAESFLFDAQDRERLPYRKEGEEGPALDDYEEGEEGDDADAEQLYDHSVAEADVAAAAAGGPLLVGMKVKSRFQGGERFCAGSIVEAHDDGTYDVLYEDNLCEQNVPREYIEVVALAANVRAALQAEEQETAAESTEQFFELFVSSLTSGAMFQNLPPDKQLKASEHVRTMRPHFEAELGVLRDARGWGAIVTGEDIKELMPKVMLRAKQAQQASS